MSQQYIIKEKTLVDIADAIREKTETSQPLTPTEMAEAIRNYEGGPTLPELSNPGSSSDLLSGKELIDGEGNIVIGNIVERNSENVTIEGASFSVPSGYYSSAVDKSVQTVEQASPTVNINSSGLITATVNQNEGYVAGETKTATKQLNVFSNTSIEPTKSAQTIAANSYVPATITINPIPTEYVDVSEATATTANVLTGATFGAGTEIKTGTMPDNGAISQTLNTTTTSYTIPAGYHNGLGEVSITTETKTVIPTALSQSITPTSGKVLSEVTVNGDANLIAENIKSSISIFGVNGSLNSGAQFATGTFTPSSTSISSSGTAICTINNLAFTPKQVIVYINAYKGMSGTSVYNGYTYPLVMFVGDINYTLYGGWASNSNDDVGANIETDNSYGLTIINNGFSWTSTVSKLRLASSYAYLAIS